MEGYTTFREIFVKTFFDTRLLGGGRGGGRFDDKHLLNHFLHINAKTKKVGLETSVTIMEKFHHLGKDLPTLVQNFD
jgi:hypothetical protein